jgi:hypothetical protein
LEKPVSSLSQKATEEHIYVGNTARASRQRSPPNQLLQ